MGISCKKHRQLALWVDGELSEKDEKKMAEHVKKCPLCARELESLNALNRMIADIPDIEPSLEFEKSLFEKIERLAQKKSPTQVVMDALMPFFRPRIIAVAATIVLVAGVLIHQRTMEPAPDDIIIATHLELLDNLDMISQLDVLEHWEDIVKPDENT